MTVLVVEDDPTVAEVVTRYLTLEGYAVDAAADGLDALQHADAHWPDLVVLDLMLPGIDGLEVCRRLRARAPVPVIMLTARGDEDDRVMGLEVGADDYVSKPFSPRELVARVRAVLRRAHAKDDISDGPMVLEAGGLRGRHCGARTHQSRESGDTHGTRVRSVDVSDATSPPRVLARRAPRARVGVHVRRHVDGDGPHPSLAREDRDRSGATPHW